VCPQVVKAKARHAGRGEPAAFDGFVEAATNHVSPLKRPAGRRCEHKPVRAGQAGREQAPSMLAQELGKLGHQDDGADGLGRLWLHACGGLAAAPWIELLANPDQPRVEVHVSPNEAEQLADTQPGEEGCCDQGSVVVGGVGEEAFDLLAGKDAHLAPLQGRPLATLEATDRVLRDRTATNSPVQG